MIIALLPALFTLKIGIMVEPGQAAVPTAVPATVPAAVPATVPAAVPDTVPRAARGAAVVDSATMASAYADPVAREMLRRARARQDSSDHSILAYQALVRSRISVGLSTLRRERLLYRRESAARIHWRRFGRHEVEVLGAREVIPIALHGVQVPDDLERSMPHFLFNPTQNRFLLGPSREDRADGMRHPLAQGSEAHYRFARGDSTLITLPDGRTVRLLELRLTPRRADPHLVSGSLWLEAESHAVVQGVFRLARPFDLDRDLDDDDARDIRWIPGLLKPIRADLRYLTIDYGLWEMRWWLPRVVALEGHASMGSLLRVPVRYELAYSEYEVFTDPSPFPLPAISMTLAGDSFPRVNCSRGTGCRCIGGECRRVEVRVPADSAALLTSAALPASIYSDGPELIDEGEVRSILARLERASMPTDFVGPRLYWGLDQPGLIRYNRVEGLAAAARLGVEYGYLGADLTARLGWADRRNPGLALGVRWEGPTYQARLGAYRELAAVDPSLQPFGLNNTVSALLWGRDEGDYYRALGVELAGGPAPGPATRLDWRVYAERQHPVEQQTWTSLRRLWSKEDPFRPNLRADSADLLGATLHLRLARGLDPVGVRWGAVLSLDGAVGTYRFLRPGATLALTGPLPGRLLGTLEGAAGTSFGELPLQRGWQLGGVTTLRGYPPITATGSAYWRARAELGSRFPGGRIVLFSDLGWAGERASFPGRDHLVAAGVGASLLDGLLRLDLARALRTPTGWRFSLATDLAL
jgi:hypothetical protein